MINWIIGGLIVTATIIIVVRAVLQARKGNAGCHCSGCPMSNGDCASKCGSTNSL